MKAPRLALLFCTLPAAIVAGCGTSSQTKEEHLSSRPVAAARDTAVRMEFETTTDTVAVETAARDSAAARERGGFQIRYMVQIGAFKDPRHASSVQGTARERYHMPVLNDYDTGLALYQIRIGFFETRVAAQDFRLRMQREFPKDYADAWVVQLMQ